MIKKLRTLDKTSDHIVNAVNCLDTRFISTDQQVAFNILETLVQVCQIDLCEEHLKAKIGGENEINGQPIWDTAEKFLIDMVDLVPCMSLKLKVWLYWRKFDQEF